MSQHGLLQHSCTASLVCWTLHRLAFNSKMCFTGYAAVSILVAACLAACMQFYGAFGQAMEVGTQVVPPQLATSDYGSSCSRLTRPLAAAACGHKLVTQAHLSCNAVQML